MQTIIAQDNSEVVYIPNFLSREECESLKTLILRDKDRFQRSIYKIFGRTVPSPRKSHSYGDEGLVYKDYSGDRVAEGWPDFLKPLKDRIERTSMAQYNYVLVNLYQNGDEYIGYHADREKGLVEGSTVASISLGAERDFCFKHNTSKQVTKILLQEGSLLLMKGETQKYFKHSLPKRKRVKDYRLNLTFRLATNAS
jgi:alkylated DNA repair dioxygenase AlkB